MTQKRMSNRLTKARADQAMELLLTGDKTLPQIAQELGVPLRAIAEWATDPTTIRRAFGFSLLNDVRLALFLGTMRPSASMRLFKLTEEPKDKDERETARKACVDLLKLDLGAKPRQMIEDAGAALPANASPRPLRPEDVMHSFQRLSGLNTQKEAYRA
jgi:hypothetical protein